MKNIIIFILFITSIGYTQIKKTEWLNHNKPQNTNYIDMYPLSDSIEYWDNEAFFDTKNISCVREILGDTIIQNHRYTKLLLHTNTNSENQEYYVEYLRKDSLGNIFTFMSQDTLLYNIHSNQGDVNTSPFDNLEVITGLSGYMDVFDSARYAKEFYFRNKISKDTISLSILVENVGVFRNYGPYLNINFLELALTGLKTKSLKLGELLSKEETDWNTYYPLKKGNWWKYHEWVGGGITRYSKEECLGDTIINGLKLYIIKRVQMAPFPGTTIKYVYWGEKGYYSYIPSVGMKVLECFLSPRVGDTCTVIANNTWQITWKGDYTDETVEHIPSIWSKNNGLVYQYYNFLKNIGPYIHEYEGAGTADTLKGWFINGKYYGDTTALGINDKEEKIINNYELSQNYPNPFNPNTIISYSLPQQCLVGIKVYDILGKEVAILVNEQKKAGAYDVRFNAKNLTSGVYFYTIKAGDFVQTKKMILVK